MKTTFKRRRPQKNDLAPPQTEKTTFSCKDDEGKSLHVYWSWGKRLVKIKTAPSPSLHNLSCACLHHMK